MAQPCCMKKEGGPGSLGPRPSVVHRGLYGAGTRKGCPYGETVVSQPKWGERGKSLQCGPVFGICLGGRAKRRAEIANVMEERTNSVTPIV